MDSVNRHLLSCYGATGINTPNIERLAARGITFDNHYSGSLPCMPARREMMTGRHNFLEAPWGPIQPWDSCLPGLLRDQRGTYSHMVTDHYHYFHSGGEGFHTLFDSYELERGQEGDAWRPLVTPPPQPSHPAGKPKHARFYSANRTFMDLDDDASYATPRTFMRAIDFLEHNHQADNWHLHLELFDPHEPFDCPQRYRDLYEDSWKGEHYTWPDYLPVDPEADSPEAIAHIRKCYAATLTMVDTWLGKFLDKIDELGIQDDTVIVLTTDHGFLLGDHGYWAKNYMFDYEKLVHIPLIVSGPESLVRRGREEALSTTIDLVPTFLDLHGCSVPETVQGRSLLPLLSRDTPSELHTLHEAVLYGYFGKDLGMFDGQYSYCRQPLEGSIVHHHTAMPTAFHGFIDREKLATAEVGTFLSSCLGIPHFRIPVRSHRHHGAPDFNPIFDVRDDPTQSRPIRDEALEARLAEQLRGLLLRFEAPECQFTRTGLER